MGDVSKEQEQAIARSTKYLVTAALSILMIFIAGVFLSAELKQQALQKAEISQQIDVNRRSLPAHSGYGPCGEGNSSAMLPVKQ